MPLKLKGDVTVGNLTGSPGLRINLALSTPARRLAWKSGKITWPLDGLPDPLGGVQVRGDSTLTNTLLDLISLPLTSKLGV